VAIDIQTETVLPFAAAARRLPRLRADRPVNPATLWRWGSHGLRGVRLETCRVGGTRCTSMEALARFFAALEGRKVEPAQVRTADSTEAELDRIGVRKHRDPQA
jgi:hypothetical protein